jgi:rSAM/selenodomain-associated transferase 2
MSSFMISIIIPTYNEEKALPHTLRELFDQSGDYEVLVVDGGSIDRTLAVLAEFGFQNPSPLTPHPSRKVLAAPKGRAAQMNVGAKCARGEWLLFLHADTQLPLGALQRLNEMEEDQTVQAGGFMHRFSSDDWRLKFISFMDNFRCIRSHIIYGDQALFVRRALFEQLGGFPEQPILEDVAFCEKLIKRTTPLLLPSPVITDSRKFVQMGIWRSFVRVLAIILHVEWGLPTLTPAFFRDIR